MAWIAIADAISNRFSPLGIGVSGDNCKVSLDADMSKGSLLVETKIPSHDRPQTLVGFRREQSNPCSFTLQSVPGGGIALVHARGHHVSHAVLDHDAEARADILRITYSWDMSRNWARLVVERPETSSTFRVTLQDPIALTLRDVRELTLNTAGRALSPDVLFFAVSNTIEPIGPMPALTPSVPIATPSGYRKIGDFKRGDLVTTLEGETVPVLQVVRRIVPARGLFEPVRLRHPYFGLKQDVVVAPGQRLVIGGSRVEYLFGAEQVLVPARHLVNGSAAVCERGHAQVAYMQLVLPDHQAVLVAGTYLETMDIGRIRRKPEILAASLLGQFERNSLPEHSGTACPVLGPFEAITLAEQRAA